MRLIVKKTKISRFETTHAPKGIERIMLATTTMLQSEKEKNKSQNNDLQLIEEKKKKTLPSNELEKPFYRNSASSSSAIVSLK